jgi:hypothetical protein
MRLWSIDIIPDTTSSFYTGLYAVFHHKNNYGNFYIIQLKCTAAAYCATYYLLDLIDAKAAKAIKIATLASDENESEWFEYKLASDTSLPIFQIKYDNELEKAIDTSKNIIFSNRKINL